MPKLPSGRTFGVVTDHIFEPGTHLFACPEGDFWYLTPDPAIHTPPFTIDEQLVGDFAHAPCPSTVEGILSFIDVVEFIDDTTYFRTGMRLSQKERPASWTEDDWRDWTIWIESSPTQTFLQETLAKCRAQAEANTYSSGGVKVTLPPETAEQYAARSRAKRFLNEIYAIEPVFKDALARDDDELASEMFDRLVAVESEMRKSFEQRPHLVDDDWRAEGALRRVRREFDLAEKAFLRAIKIAPFDPRHWLDLAAVRGQAGKHQLSEAAARRALELDDPSSLPWANLSVALFNQDRFDEAKAAAAASLAIDPADWVALAVMQRLSEVRGTN